MTQPVSYVEINSSDRDASRRFLSDVFGWDFQPFATSDYLVAPHGDAAGIDTGLIASRDGNAFSVPIIRVDSIDGTRRLVEEHGGVIVVEPFAVPGVGRGCYFTDPAGVLVGLHEYNAAAE